MMRIMSVIPVRWIWMKMRWRNSLLMNGKTEEEVKAFLQEAEEANAHLSVSFDAPDNKGLNIKSKEDNPLMDILVQAVENQ